MSDPTRSSTSPLRFAFELPGASRPAPGRWRRAGLSFLSTVLACGATFLLMMAGFRLFLGWRGSADGSLSFLAMTVIFSFAGWLFVFLPLVLLLDPRSGVLKPAVFPWVGAAASVLLFFLSTPLWGGPQVFPSFAAYAAVVGLLAGLTYSLLLRRSAKPE